jgi:hypothetical protein
MRQAETPGSQFAGALAAKDFDRIRELVDPHIDFRGLTPNRTWEATDAEDLVARILREWFEETDDIEAVEHLDCDSFADRQRVGYRFRVRNPDGRFLVEQQAYLAAREGRIVWMRVVCSGFRPADA